MNDNLFSLTIDENRLLRQRAKQLRMLLEEIASLLINALKALNTPLVIVKDQYSHLLYPNIR